MKIWTNSCTSPSPAFKALTALSPPHLWFIAFCPPPHHVCSTLPPTLSLAPQFPLWNAFLFFPAAPHPQIQCLSYQILQCSVPMLNPPRNIFLITQPDKVTSLWTPQQTFWPMSLSFMLPLFVSYLPISPPQFHSNLSQE